MSAKKRPRLITKVIRGTKRYMFGCNAHAGHKLKTFHSASERTNSTAKEDHCVLARPRVRGLASAAVLSQLAVVVLLLKRISCFIIKVTLSLTKIFRQNESPPTKPFLPGPRVPNFMRNLIQRE